MAVNAAIIYKPKKDYSTNSFCHISFVYKLKLLGYLNNDKDVKYMDSEQNNSTKLVSRETQDRRQVFRKKIEKLITEKPQNSYLWNRLSEIEQLQEGWDSDCGKPIPTETIELVLQIITKTLDLNMSEPEVGAVPDGSLDLNWIDQGIYCTLDFKEASIYHYEIGQRKSYVYPKENVVEDFLGEIWARSFGELNTNENLQPSNNINLSTIHREPAVYYWRSKSWEKSG